MEPHGLTAVIPTIVRRNPPKHFKNLPTAGPSDAFIPGLTPEVFCVGGQKRTEGRMAFRPGIIGDRYDSLVFFA
jgi:hypothetical protein